MLEESLQFLTRLQNKRFDISYNCVQSRCTIICTKCANIIYCVVVVVVVIFIVVFSFYSWFWQKKSILQYRFCICSIYLVLKHNWQPYQFLYLFLENCRWSRFRFKHEDIWRDVLSEFGIGGVHVLFNITSGLRKEGSR